MNGLKMFETWDEMYEQVRVETSWYRELNCRGIEVSSFETKG